MAGPIRDSTAGKPSKDMNRSMPIRDLCAQNGAIGQELRQAEWKPSPKTDADAECEFLYQPDGWGKPYRFVALRKQKPREELEAEETEQYQLFETSQYKARDRCSSPDVRRS